MELPIHPMLVHLPLGLSLILPLLILIFLILIKLGKMDSKLWSIIIGLQLLLTFSGYVTITTGENEEEIVKEVVSKKLIALHETKAEMFVGASVITLVLSVGSFFIDRKFQFKTHLTVLAASLFTVFLAFRAGESGGRLVYEHGAASAYETSLSEDEVNGTD